MALDFDLSADQLELQQTARKACRAASEHWRNQPAGGTRPSIVEASWQVVSEFGGLANLVPRSQGGTERGLLPLMLLIEEMGAANLSPNLAVLSAVSTILIDRHGTPRLREQHLPTIAQGVRRYCLAITEEDAGFNILRATTSARREGDQYRITGRKRYISGADIADFMLVLARTLTPAELQSRGLPKTVGLSLFVVDPKAQGINRRPLAAHGDGGLTPFELTFENVAVAADSRVADEHMAVAPMFAAFNAERILFAAEGLGLSQYCLDRACEHARKREVFKGPIGAYQSIQHPLAEVKVLQEAVRLATYRAAWCFDRGDDPTTVSVHANSAKLLAAQLALKAVDAALNTFGGKGFDEEYGLIHLWEQARLMKTSPISEALILNGIAEQVLGLPRSY